MAKKRARSKQIKKLRQWHYVVYRSVRTGKQRKFDSRVKLIAEVFSTKTRSRIGYINKVVKGRPQPRKFSRKAKLIYHEGKKETRRFIEKTYGDSFLINYSTWIPNQIPKWFTKLLNDEIDNKGFVQFRLRLSGKDNKGILQDVQTETYNSPIEKNHRDWIDLLTTLIVSALRGNQIRTSPKKFSKSRYWYRGPNIAQWHFLKKYKVELVLRGY